MSIQTDTFIIDKKESQVSFDGVNLTWTDKKKTRLQLTVRAIIRAECSSQKGPHLTVHYVITTGNLGVELTVKKLTLGHKQQETCQHWKDSITSALFSLEPKRPRRLLLFVNPISGGGHGLSIYQKQILPLFKLAEVEIDFIETKHADHSKEVLATYDLSTIDGIAIAGGDGSILQTTSALLHRQNADAGREITDPSSEPVCTTIPIGVLPAGTGQFMVGATTGTKDVSSAVLRIILGDTFKGPVITVFNDEKFVSYSNFMCAHGMFADMIHRVEQNRHLGRLRYLTGMLRLFFYHIKEYDFEVEVFHPENDNKETEENKQSNAESTVVKEPLIAANIYKYGMISFEGGKGDVTDWITFWRKGLLHIHLMQPMSKGNLLKFVKQMMTLKPDATNLPKMINLIGNRVTVRQPAIGQDPECSSCVNLDGEPTLSTNPLFEYRGYNEKIVYYGVCIGEDIPKFEVTKETGS